MATVQDVPRLVEIAYYEQPHEDYVPTHEDWEDYRRILEREEAMEMLDRSEEMERHRRQAWNRAEFAVIHIEGVAAGLSASGLDSTARTLLAACENINAVLRQYV